MTKEHRDTFFKQTTFLKNYKLFEKQLFQLKDKLAVRSSAIEKMVKHKVVLVNTLSVFQCIEKKSRPIITCWASMFSDRVTHYSESHHKMAVVIQEYVVSKWSGKLHIQSTPRNGSFSELLLNPFQTLEKSRFFAVIPDYLVMRRPRPSLSIL